MLYRFVLSDAIVFAMQLNKSTYSKKLKPNNIQVTLFATV